MPSDLEASRLVFPSRSIRLYEISIDQHPAHRKGFVTAYTSATACCPPRSCSAHVEMIAPGLLDRFSGQLWFIRSPFVSVAR